MRFPPIALLRVAAWLLCATVAACRPADVPPHLVDVIGSDYAFTVPDTVAAGPTLVSFASRGAVPHEMVLYRLSDGASTAEAADSLMHGHKLGTLRASGGAVLFTAPHQTENPVRVSVNFERGHRYAMLCQFRDSATAPKHQTLGMFKILTVR